MGCTSTVQVLLSVLYKCSVLLAGVLQGSLVSGDGAAQRSGTHSAGARVDQLARDLLVAGALRRGVRRPGAALRALRRLRRAARRPALRRRRVCAALTWKTRRYVLPFFSYKISSRHLLQSTDGVF